MTLITISMPFWSPPSYLKLHMPSFSLFQYAPTAECMPRRPTGTGSLLPGTGDKCWMMVLLTAYLKLGCEVGPLLVSLMSDFRIVFWGRVVSRGDGIEGVGERLLG